MPGHLHGTNLVLSLSLLLVRDPREPDTAANVAGQCWAGPLVEVLEEDSHGSTRFVSFVTQRFYLTGIPRGPLRN